MRTDVPLRTSLHATSQPAHRYQHTTRRLGHAPWGPVPWGSAPLLTALALLLTACSSSSAAGSQATATATTMNFPTATTTATTPVPIPTPLASPPPAPPSVYFATGKGASSTVYALNPINGAVRWRSASIQGNAGGVFSVLLAHNVVYALGSGGPLIALQAADGKERWRVSTHRVIAPLVMDDGIIYLSSSADSFSYGFVDAYRASDGKLLWEYNTGPSGGGELAAANGVLYLNVDLTLLALRGSDGAILWQHAQNTSIGGIPVVADGTIYYNRPDEVFAFNAADGAQRWTFRQSYGSSPYGFPLSVGNGLVFTGFATTLYALHASDGTLAWSKAYSRTYIEATSFAGGILYVTQTKGTVAYGGLVALQAADGKQLWGIQLSDHSAAPPVLAGGTLYINITPTFSSSPPGVVYALRPSNGSILWQYRATAGDVSPPVVG